MIVPEYVKELMLRSHFVRGYGDPGYTIKIEKRTENSLASTLEAEIKRLEKWVNRMIPDEESDIPVMIIHNVPKETTKTMQYAIVSIYDPVMTEIEKYIDL